MPTVPGAGSVNPTLTAGTDMAVATQVSAMIANAASTTTMISGGIAPTPSGTPAALAITRTGQTNISASNYPFIVVGDEASGDTSSLSVTSGGGLNQAVLLGSGSVAFYATSGSGTIVGGDGGKTVDIGIGDNFGIYTGGGNDVISLANSRGTGVNTVDAGTGGNTVLLGATPADVHTTGADTIDVSTGAVTVQTTGIGQDTVTGTAGTRGSGTVTVINSSASSSVSAGIGSATTTGGAGGGAFTGGSSGANLLVGGTGTVTLQGAGAGDVLVATSIYAPSYVLAGAGNETLLGSLSTQNNVYAAGSGPDLILAGAGNDTIYAGRGSSTITGGGGANLYVFDPSRSPGGSVLITDFAPGTDHVLLQNYPGVNVASVVSGAQAVGGERVTLPDGTSITFQNVTSVNTGFF